MSTIYGEGFVADLMVTPWLSGHWKPVRVGCYERNYGPWLDKKEPVPLRDWWDGEQWRYLGDLGIGGVCVRQNQAWRGLTQPPKAGVDAPPAVQPVGWQWLMAGGRWGFCESERMARACAEAGGTTWRPVYAGPCADGVAIPLAGQRQEGK